MKIYPILFFLVTNVFAQDTKFVSRKSELDIEEYYVLKSDPKIKEGTYVRYRNGGMLGFIALESGKYKNGKKDGLWETFYLPSTVYPKNSIKERGHYVGGKKNGLWLFYYIDTLNNVTKASFFGKKNKPDSINVTIQQGSANLRQAGMFLNDKRVGEWTSFDVEGRLVQKYNYSNGGFYDRSLGDSTGANFNRHTVFLGGSEQLSYLLSFELNWYNAYSHISSLGKPEETIAIASFAINEKGEMTNLMISKSSSVKRFDTELLRLVRLTENAWIPGLKDGVRAESNASIQLMVRSKKKGPYYVNVANFEFNKP